VCLRKAIVHKAFINCSMHLTVKMLVSHYEIRLKQIGFDFGMDLVFSISVANTGTVTD